MEGLGPPLQAALKGQEHSDTSRLLFVSLMQDLGGFGHETRERLVGSKGGPGQRAQVTCLNCQKYDVVYKELCQGRKLWDSEGLGVPGGLISFYF